MKYKIKIFFLIMLFFPVILFGQDKPINEEWLKIDKSTFLNLMDVLLSNNNSIHFYQKNLKNLGQENQDIGFNAKRHIWHQGGGYVDNWMTICSYKDTIFYCKILITSTDVEKIEILAQRDSTIQNLLNQNWRKKYSESHEYLEFEYLNEELYSKYKTIVKNEFGEFREKEADSLIYNDIQILTSPFENYAFGYACSVAGMPPKGRIAIENIKKYDPTIVKDIILGYNPEGRIYGIEAFLELVEQKKLEMTTEDRNIIKKVLNLNILINECSGCIFTSILAKDLFREKKYRELLKKNDIDL